jgi:hypothetical protein
MGRFAKLMMGAHYRSVAEGVRVIYKDVPVWSRPGRFAKGERPLGDDVRQGERSAMRRRRSGEVAVEPELWRGVRIARSERDGSPAMASGVRRGRLGRPAEVSARGGRRESQAREGRPAMMGAHYRSVAEGVRVIYKDVPVCRGARPPGEAACGGRLEFHTVEFALGVSLWCPTGDVNFVIAAQLCQLVKAAWERPPVETVRRCCL